VLAVSSLANTLGRSDDTASNLARRLSVCAPYVEQYGGCDGAALRERRRVCEASEEVHDNAQTRRRAVDRGSPRFDSVTRAMNVEIPVQRQRTVRLLARTATDHECPMEPLPTLHRCL
jgi:hypothetical protein